MLLVVQHKRWLTNKLVRLTESEGTNRTILDTRDPHKKVIGFKLHDLLQVRYGCTVYEHENKIHTPKSWVMMKNIYITFVCRITSPQQIVSSVLVLKSQERIKHFT